jgi:hypothetical protein
MPVWLPILPGAGATNCRSFKEVHDDIWPASFMDSDLGYFDLGTRVLEPLDNRFGPWLSPM